MNKTRYFQNCLGVFQGGGCKGAAYVGAFKECVKRGVSFSEIVGASAGAIVAVFIAAGATTEQLETIIRELDFKEFLRPGIDLEIDKAPFLSKTLKWSSDKKYNNIYTIITKLGLYESTYIETFVDENLKKILNKPHSIKFEDLIIPCSVVTSDLETNDAKVYSTENTPYEVVAKAVRKSANIPIFFQPIENRYVDGGMLSNLPVYLFNEKDSLYSKVLAFTFTTKLQTVKSIKNTEDYALALINTSLFGNLNIQLSLMDNITYLEINTGDIEATDFEKIDGNALDYLISQGVEGAKSFFDDESNRIKDTFKRSDVNINSYDSKNAITDSNNEKVTEILFIGKNTSWVYDLFPTLIRWVENTASIKILLKDNNDEVIHGEYRQRLLRHLGAEIVQVKNIPFEGFIFSSGRESSDWKKAIIYNTTPEYHAYDSKNYYGKEDKDVLNILHSEVISHFKLSSKSGPIEYQQVKTEELISELRNVRQYSGEHVEITLQEIDINNIFFLTKFVRGFKFRQIQHMLEIYRLKEIEHFKPMKVKYPLNDKSTLITPPIIEVHGGQYIVIEGNTRLTYLYKNGIIKCYVIVIKNVTEPPPSTGRFTCKEILITDIEKKGDTRYPKFEYDRFRDIEQSVRDPKICLI